MYYILKRSTVKHRVAHCGETKYRMLEWYTHYGSHEGHLVLSMKPDYEVQCSAVQRLRLFFS